MRERVRDRRAHDDAAADLVAFRDVRARDVELSERADRILVPAAPALGDGELAAADERRAEILLERGELAAHRRDGYPEALRYRARSPRRTLLAMNLENTIALVTGSNRGLGHKLVEDLLARGAKKVYAASRAGTSDFTDPRVVALALDITNEASVLAAAKAANDIQLLDNNAGVFSAGPVLEATEAQLRGDMDVNYHGLLRIVRGFRSVLAANKGSIANVLSVVSFANCPPLAGTRRRKRRRGRSRRRNASSSVRRASSFTRRSRA